MTIESERDTSKIPPPPSVPSELRRYPAFADERVPDWVDRVARRAVAMASLDVLAAIDVRLGPALERIERAVHEGHERTDLKLADALERIGRLEERVARLEGK